MNEAIDQGVSWKEGEAEAYNLRGTFKWALMHVTMMWTDQDRFLIGDSVAAKADLEKSLDLVPSFVQSWVKIASVHMELGEQGSCDWIGKLRGERGDAASAFGDFEAAIRHNPDDPDIYYHRGQGMSQPL